jgi:hypothetical protein
VQVFVSSSPLQEFRDRGARPPLLGQIDNAWSVSLAEPERGIKFETESIIGRMAGRADH